MCPIVVYNNVSRREMNVRYFTPLIPVRRFERVIEHIFQVETFTVITVSSTVRTVRISPTNIDRTLYTNDMEFGVSSGRGSE